MEGKYIFGKELEDGSKIGTNTIALRMKLEGDRDGCPCIKVDKLPVDLDIKPGCHDCWREGDDYNEGVILPYTRDDSGEILVGVAYQEIDLEKGKEILWFTARCGFAFSEDMEAKIISISSEESGSGSENLELKQLLFLGSDYNIRPISDSKKRNAGKIFCYIVEIPYSQIDDEGKIKRVDSAISEIEKGKVDLNESPITHILQDEIRFLPMSDIGTQTTLLFACLAEFRVCIETGEILN